MKYWWFFPISFHLLISSIPTGLMYKRCNLKHVLWLNWSGDCINKRLGLFLWKFSHWQNRQIPQDLWNKHFCFLPLSHFCLIISLVSQWDGFCSSGPAFIGNCHELVFIIFLCYSYFYLKYRMTEWQNCLSYKWSLEI